MTPCRVVMLLALSSSILHADLTLKVRTTSATHPTVERAVYYQGDHIRSEFGNTYQVHDFATPAHSFRVDSAKREYYPADESYARRKRVVDPARKLFNEMAYSDTGEQRQWFGYTAHRYLLSWKSRNEYNGKLLETHEGHTDFWVVDFPLPHHEQAITGGGMASFSMSGPDGTIIVPDVISTRSGPMPHGLIVQLKTKNYEAEIVSLSTAPLDASLFNPPPGFRKVPPPTYATYTIRPLTWTDQLTIEWLNFRAWLNSIFGS